MPVSQTRRLGVTDSKPAVTGGLQARVAVATGVLRSGVALRHFRCPPSPVVFVDKTMRVGGYIAVLCCTGH